MALLDTWRNLAYQTEMDNKTANEFWGSYFTQEKAIYEQILADPDTVVKGTVKELADKYGVEVLLMTGFLDGINDSLKTPNPIETMEEDTEVSLDYDKEKLQERVAKLAGGVAVIKVGAATEVEMKEKKDRVDDALHATRAAVEEGIVAGGGVALVRAAIEVSATLKGDNEEQDVGIKLALRAMEAPLRQIVTNAGEEASVVASAVKNGEGNFGYNAGTEQYGDMIEMGILDPTKVTRSALQFAASVAGLMITTECMVTDLPKDDKADLGAAGMGGMGGMGGMM